MTSPWVQGTVILMRLFLPVAVLIAVFSAALPVGAEANKDGRRIRNVTPDNIPVIILPPGTTAKKSKDLPHENADVAGVIVTQSDNSIIGPSGVPLPLFGVRILPQNTLCVTAHGGRWACGLRAHIAIRNFIHGKPIRCEGMAGAAGERCFRERTEISRWMLSEGWALYDEPANDPALLQISDEARKNGRGLWSDGSQPLGQ